MASRHFLNSLKKGQILKAEIEEVSSPTEALCNFQGELLLIGNLTGRIFRKGDPVFLQVVSVSPLQFQIFDGTSKFQRVI